MRFMRLSHDLPCRLARFTFTVLLALSWCGGGAALAAPGAERPAPGGAATADLAELDQAATVLERLLGVAKAELAKPGADPTDVPARAAALGNDVAKVFAFVRDEVAYEPYAGVLRGARGALAARSANSFDKALLLRAMLETGGRQARLVTGTLAADQAGTLVKQFLAGDPLKGALGEFLETASSPDALADFCKRAGLDPAKIGSFAAEVERQAAETQKGAEQQVGDVAAYLQAQLREKNVAIGQPAAKWVEELTARVGAKHVWVQVRDEAGNWSDLDPSFADAQMGQARGANPAPVTGELPDRHRVNIKLLYAHGPVGGEKEEAILTVPLNADEAITQAADFSVRPADDLPAPDKLLAMTPEARVKLLAKIEKYQAVVRSGSRQFASRVFDLKGNLFDVSADGRIKGASQVGSAVGGLFGGALGGDAEPAKPKNEFRSLAVEISFDAPEGQAPTPPQRRVLLTDKNLEGDHVLSPLVDWEILIQSQVISATQASVGSLRHLAGAIEPTVAAAKAARSGGGSGAVGKMVGAVPEPYPQLLTQWTLFREAALARALKQSPAGAVLWDAPQVVVAERRFCMNKASGHACDRSRIDIVHNGLSVVPRDASGEVVAAQLALRQGVFDTVAERVLLERVLPDGKATSAASRLEAARSAGAKLAAFGVGDISGSPLSAADQAFVKASEPQRRILVPTGAGDAWWSVDARTGSVVGRAAGGYGESLVENGMLQQLAGGVMCFLAAGKDASSAGKDDKSQRVVLFTFLACTVGMGTGVLGVVGGAGPKALGIIFYVNLAIAGGITLYK